MTAPTLVHQVVVLMATGFKMMSRDEYLTMDLSERVQFILSNKVQFLDSKGNVLSTRDALRSLRDAE